MIHTMSLRCWVSIPGRYGSIREINICQQSQFQVSVLVIVKDASISQQGQAWVSVLVIIDFNQTNNKMQWRCRVSIPVPLAC